MQETKPIIESDNFIVLANYEKLPKNSTSYQSEKDLENEFIKDLETQGYERVSFLNLDEMKANLKTQIERLNGVKFSQSEWERFLYEYLDKQNDTFIDATRKIQIDHQHSFKFDNEKLENIKIIDKKEIHKNYLQVVNQISQTGTHQNRYDVSILVNGLPLVHIELKKRGVSLNEAFNQIHRYTKESFNSQNSLYKYAQIFVISNGTFTRYFANTAARNKNNYEFTCEWADAKNRAISDLKDFTATFFQKKVLLEILTKYCVFNSSNELLIMRPYQIAASERILRKIEIGYKNKKFGSVEAGGFVWHTTGSGKTLTSFKTSNLATKLDFIDKVLFVVDRKDLDYQTKKEYESFQKNSINGSVNTKELKKNLEKSDDKIVVTTIQKLNEFIKQNKNHEIYDKHCVLIFDECHRSQFGEAQKNITKHFKKYYQFGFTGTPIFVDNALGTQTTAGVFGTQLHSYVITDAIRDEKVLKFKVDYINLSPKFKDIEKEQNLDELKKYENKLLLHPERISEVVSHILKVYDTKTHRNEIYNIKDKRLKGFNAMFAVQSVEAAKIYYTELKKQIDELKDDKKLKIATIFSFSQNETQSAKGEILDEKFDLNLMDLSSKEFLDEVIKEYNAEFRTNFSTDSKGFEGYYENLSKRVKDKEIDLLIVVGMFLTGFDAPTLNTLFVDKNLRYHGLLQAFSRTNRILNSVKTFGNIVCFRDLEEATKESIRVFGDENSLNVILEKSYEEYINGYADDGVEFKGFKALCDEMLTKFPDPTNIIFDSDKKEFAQLFGEILKTENILKNYDEFSTFESPIDERFMQDLKSAYIEIKDEVYKNKNSDLVLENTKEKVDFSDVTFEIELLKTDEINLDYILALILEKTQQNEDPNIIKSDIKRMIRSSLDVRAKESLIMEFLEKQDIKKLKEKSEILESFYTFAKGKKDKEIKNLIENENLQNNISSPKKLIESAIKKGFVDENGTWIDEIMPVVSRRGGERQKKKLGILEKIKKIVEIFVGI
ncbi:type I restriction endonuclease subunit R [Campylobacter corcagiensis]|uniref:Type I restriction enzyme endonuclease subunit n=1 Tax=Campylobacter corcagiensis TaxID=1448857 RepID=A0A7M1LF73_9BACT|nr:type I restriction endonuclease subunit R [Campylobacter corcagiensis]QKF64756.1 type I restriction/modification system, restriction subunit [Campylobacter corcagiensis]QOQ87080.1 type I restriction endonuclease subunit R [Campylobacter corcagiensis]